MTHEQGDRDDKKNLDPCTGSATARRLLPKRGNYRTLITYQKAEVIYDITYRFCRRFLEPRDRTADQMLQAARSAKQNIVEGSKAGAASRESEIKLTNVARAGLKELLQDFQDYLRVRNLGLWDKNSRESRFVRKLGTRSPITYEDFRSFVETRDSDVIANIAVCLIYQTTYLLDRQLDGLGESFLKEGGFREHMTRERLKARAERNTRTSEGGNT